MPSLSLYFSSSYPTFCFDQRESHQASDGKWPQRTEINIFWGEIKHINSSTKFLGGSKEM